MEEPRIQPIFVGVDDAFAKEFFRRLGDRCHDAIRLAPEDWAHLTWQRARGAGPVWCVVALGAAPSMELMTRWVQLLTVTLRPSRLILRAPMLRLPETIALVRAGADGFLRHDCTVDDLVRELEAEPERREGLLPDPSVWLDSLARASEELLAVRDPRERLRRLLRIFKAQLHVDRASIVLIRGGKTVLAAGMGMPPSLSDGMELTIAPDSITRWVFDNRRPRYVHGALDDARKDTINSAVCAPLLAQGELLGAVSFTCFAGGHQLTPADLSTAQVFASLLAFSIANARLMEEKLETERLATIGQTAAMVSHCIKNYMQSVTGGVFIAKRAFVRKDEETLEKGLQMVDSAAERLRGVVVDLLDFSKEREASPEPCSPAGLLNDIRDSIVRTYPQAKIAVDVDCRDGADCYVDRVRLERALVNLAQNACEAMGSKGTLRLEYHREGDTLKFMVSDSGPGANEETLAKMFDPFFSTKGGKGTGLGLAMVQKFVREAGGQISAVNVDNPGGLQVTIELPAETRLLGHPSAEEPPHD